jgi:hypothetical protein
MPTQLDDELASVIHTAEGTFTNHAVGVTDQFIEQLAILASLDGTGDKVVADGAGQALHERKYKGWGGGVNRED